MLSQTIEVGLERLFSSKTRAIFDLKVNGRLISLLSRLSHVSTRLRHLLGSNGDMERSESTIARCATLKS